MGIRIHLFFAVLLGFIGAALTPGSAVAQTRHKRPKPLTTKAKRPNPCGLSSQKATRRPLALLRATQFQSFLRGLKSLAQQGWIKGIDTTKLDRGLLFLRSRLVRLLGLQWSHGVWLSVYDKGSAKRAKKPLSWLPTSPASIDWKKATQALHRLEVTAELRLRRSWMLGFAMRQLLALTPYTHYVEKIGSYRTYWLKPPRGPVLVIVVASSRLYLRLLWDPSGIDTPQGRRKRWQKEVQNVTSLHGRSDFLKAQMRINQSFSAHTQGIAYLQPQHLCHFLSPLPMPKKKHVLKNLARYDGYGVGGHLTTQDAQAHERSWSRSKRKVPPPPPSILKWLPATTRWLTTLNGARWPTSLLYSFFPSPPPKSFYKRLLVAMAQEIQRRGWMPSGSWLYRESLAQWWLETLLLQRWMAWVESPALTASMTRLPRGLLAMGFVKPAARSIIEGALGRVQGAIQLGGFGQPSSFLLPIGGRQFAFTWQGNRWFLASHAGLLERLLRRAKSPKKGTLLRFTPTGSLLHLAGWNARWNLWHLHPARLGCAWQPGMNDALAKRLASHVKHIELASLLSARHQRATIRIAWKSGGLLPPKAAYPSCWGRSALWQRLSQSIYAVPLGSPVFDLARPFLPRLLQQMRKPRKTKIP